MPPDESLEKLQVEKLQAEISKLKEEKHKLSLERQELENPWYKKDKYLQAIAAGILAVPLLWFFFDSVVRPIYVRDTKILERENRLISLDLQDKEIEFDQAQSKMQAAWDELASNEATFKDEKTSLEMRIKDLEVDYKKLLGKAKDTKLKEKIKKDYENFRVAQKLEPKVGKDKSFSVENDLLHGRGATFTPSPNHSGAIKPRLIVLHSTNSRNLESSVKWLTNPASKQSTHLLIGRDGKVEQIVPFNSKAWHSGMSFWKGVKNLNKISIGISLVNAGSLREQGGSYRAWFGEAYPKSEVLRARHKLEKEETWWHEFTPAQLKAVEEICSVLVKKYGITEILGHDDISPARKRDPGPAFPLQEIQERVFKKI